MNNKRYTHHSGNSKGFGSSVPETGDKDQINFLLYHRKKKKERKKEVENQKERKKEREIRKKRERK